jgi:hypothetical protein
LILFFTSCNQQGGNKEKNKSQEGAVVNPSIADSLTMTNHFDAFGKLEKFFDNNNYQVIKSKDTNYFYFSRSSDFLLKVYQYKIIKGDSAFLKIDSIQLAEDGKALQWKFADQQLHLISASDDSNNWKSSNLDSTIFTFKKLNKKDFQLVEPKNSTTTFSQTITLSSFLVRSLYDYQHGTRFAFDTANFTKKSGKIKPLF